MSEKEKQLYNNIYIIHSEVKYGIFKKLNKGLKKTRDNMSGAINAALYGKTR